MTNNVKKYLTTPLYLSKVAGMSNISNKSSIRDKKRVWRNEDALRVAEALTAIDDVETMKNFMRDIMTETEIEEFAARLRAAYMLANGRNYVDITKETKLSSRTIARISDWLKNGCGGYWAAMKAISKHHLHTPPERLG